MRSFGWPTAFRCWSTGRLIASGNTGNRSASIRRLRRPISGDHLGERPARDRRTGGRYWPAQVLFGLDLELAEGQAATLLGRNGMGKTTTARHDRPAAGHGRDDLVSPASASTAGVDHISRAGIGRWCRAGQFPESDGSTSMLATFFANRRRQPVRGRRPGFDLFPAPAGERARNLGNQLSGGEQQMLAIGRALTNRAC